MGDGYDILKFETEQWAQETLIAFAEILPGSGTLLGAFTALTGRDAIGNRVSGGQQSLAAIFTLLELVTLGAGDDFGEAVVDGARMSGRHGRRGRNMERIADLTDDMFDTSRGIRRAGDNAGDTLSDALGVGRKVDGSGGCFKPGTVLHKIAADPEAEIALFEGKRADDDSVGSFAWWILTAISAAVVFTALQNERKRRRNEKPVGAVALATSALDELFTSETPWEPPLWNEQCSEFAVS